jgi:HEPN domain-containing protein
MGRQDAQAWLEQARHDLAAARDSLAAGHFEWACFQSQQGAEKALKAYLLMAGRSHQRIHAVTELLDECVRLDPEFERIRPSIELDQYYVSARYPDALAGGPPYRSFTQQTAERCLSLASSLIEFVARSIAS